MPLSSIVTIILRLFSLSWLVQGIAIFAAYAKAMGRFESPFLNPWTYAVPIFLILAAIIAWLFAPFLSRLITHRPDSSVDVGGLNRYDLYCFAFVFLGLYFVLSALADSINSIHHYTYLAKMTAESDPQRQESFYRLTQPLITVIAGCACIAFSARLSKKLTNAQRSYDTA